MGYNSAPQIHPNLEFIFWDASIGIYKVRTVFARADIIIALDTVLSKVIVTIANDNVEVTHVPFLL